MEEEISLQLEHRVEQDEEMTIMPLGGGQEVGRSCILLQYRGRTVMLDCGNHPGREGMDAHPFFDFVDADKVDVILITHFHIDHCAALPYFTEQTKFKGKIYMTHATKAVMRLMISDFVKLGGGNKSTSNLYSDQDFRRCMDKIEVIDYHTTVVHNGIQFCAYVAGHVLGAAMFSIHIDGVKVLYTGDYSTEEDRHLMSAEIPPDRPDVLIVESTYGVTNHSSREEREARFTSTVESIVRRKGNCLIPVFALGRAQELLLILDEYWKSNPDLQDIPIFYASKMASKALRVYQTFVNMMNTHIQALMDVKNPFHFYHIKSSSRGSDNAMQFMAPCVVMAAPGMLQSGESRRLFEDWCDNEKNGVVLAGYSVEGTLAKKLLSDPEEIVCLNGRIKKCHCSIEYISFSAHVDYKQNSKFIRTVLPDNIILVHGEKNEMSRLKGALDREIEQSWPDSTHIPPVVMPGNCQPVKITFANPIVADVVGTVATSILGEIQEVANDQESYEIQVPEQVVVVTENFQSKVVEASEMHMFTSCRVSQIEQQMVVPLPQEILQLRQHNDINVIHMLIPHLQEVFDSVDKNETKKDCSYTTTVIVQGEIIMQEENGTERGDCITVTWNASPTNDLMADCATGLLFQVLSATHFLRACWLEANKMQGKSVSGSKRQYDKHSPNTDEATLSSTPLDDSDDTVIIKKMKMGLLDPSRSFLRDNKIDGLIYENMDPQTIEKSRPKLEIIRTYLLQYRNNMFQSVSFSHNGLRLIIRAHEDTAHIEGDDVISEAYCYIHWADKGQISKQQTSQKTCNGHKHTSSVHQCHAVVQSNSLWLRGEIAQALSKLDSVM